MARFLVVDLNNLALIVCGHENPYFLAQQLLVSAIGHDISHIGWLPSLSTTSTPRCVDSKMLNTVANMLYRLDIVPLPPGFWPKNAYIYPSNDGFVERLTARPIRQRIVLDNYLLSPELTKVLEEEKLFQHFSVSKTASVTQPESILLLDREGEVVVQKMLDRGCLFDRESLESYARKLEVRINKIDNYVHSQFDISPELKLSNKNHVSKIIFNEGGRSTSIQELKKLKRSDNPTEDQQYRLATLVSRYRTICGLKHSITSILSYMDDSDRVRCSKITRTDTGRIIGSKPNLMGIPKHDGSAKTIREAYIAENGFSLVRGDFSQIDLRMMAHLTGDPELVNGFINGADIHLATASAIFNKPLADISGHERSKAKALNFGIVYGQGAKGFANQSGLSLKESETYIDNYFKKYPKVKEWQKEIIRNSQKLGVVETILGRKISASGRQRNAIINAPVQGSSSDLFIRTLIAIDKAIKVNGFRAALELTVHDEIVYSCHIDEVVDFAKLMKTEAEGAQKLSVPIVFEVGEGKNWYEASL